LEKTGNWVFLGFDSDQSLIFRQIYLSLNSTSYTQAK
jgi:hypothetical protein